MAIIRSVVMGRARKSIGQVTMTTIGGVCMSRQKVGENKSNTTKQARWRSRFRDAMTTGAWLVPLAKDAYKRRGLKSAWNELQKHLFWCASGFNWNFENASAGDIAYQAMQAQGDYQMSFGDIRVANAQYLHVGDHNLLLLTINENIYNLLGIEEGDEVDVNADYFLTSLYYHSDHYSSPITYHGHPTSVGIYDMDFQTIVALEMPLVSGESTAEVYLKSCWPVIRLNGRRLNMRAWTYFRELGM